MKNMVERYRALCHSLQTGVMQRMKIDADDVINAKISSTQPETSPKMLRTGINTALVEQSAVARLLMEKGIFTEQEYFTALIVGMENEVRDYETYLSRRMNAKVTLV